MEFKRIYQSYFRLNIIGYQFPQMQTEEFDSNWLLIQVEANGPKGKWVAIDPCLLTYEVERLAGWLDRINSEKSIPSTIGFIEPNLEFSVCEYRQKC